jgi:hypothetical protein
MDKKQRREELVYLQEGDDLKKGIEKQGSGGVYG